MDSINFSDEHFRLIIATDAAPNLPTSLLEISLRQYVEPATGLKAKVIASLTWIEQDRLEAVSTSEWVTLVYAMSFLHSWMLARRELTHGGWSLMHEFHRNDLLLCFDFMKSIIEANEHKSHGMSRPEIPWHTAQQMYTEIILGSAVLQKDDKTVLETEIKRYVSSRVYASDFHYGLDFPGPFGQDMHSTVRHLLIHNVTESVGVFGLDSAVSIEFERTKSENLVSFLSTALSLLNDNLKVDTNTTYAGNEEPVLERAKHILDELPSDIALPDDDDGNASPLRGLKSPLMKSSGMPVRQSVVAMQHFALSEHRQLLVLLETVRRNMRDVISTLNGGLRMSKAHHSIAVSLLLGSTPNTWMAISFAIPQLSKWFDHVKEAHSQVSMMLGKFGGSVGLGHCFCPAALMRFHLQTICTKRRLAHEAVNVILKIGGTETSGSDKANELDITGLWIQGAGMSLVHCWL